MMYQHGDKSFNLSEEDIRKSLKNLLISLKKMSVEALKIIYTYFFK